MADPLIEIVETHVFAKRADKLLTRRELDAIVVALAANPTLGALVVGGGGTRKVRFAAGGSGKSGGVRVIYYFHDTETPLFLLDLYAKNQKDDLSAGELAQLAALIKGSLIPAAQKRRRK